MDKSVISIIAAIGASRELGKDGKIPWHIPEDFSHFKKVTTNHPVIMGRKTFESLGKPLPNRTNVVVTRDAAYKAPGCVVVTSLEQGIAEANQPKAGQPLAGKHDNVEIFVIGGGQIYEQAIPLADKLYLTVVDGKFDADTFFPKYSEFSRVLSQKTVNNGKHQFTFFELTK